MKKRPASFSRLGSILIAILTLSGATTGVSHHSGNGSGDKKPDNGGSAPERPIVVEVPGGESGAPAANALAHAIAADAGGHPDQYAYYADQLARTLGHLSAAQRARVFGGQ